MLNIVVIPSLDDIYLKNVVYLHYEVTGSLVSH